MPLLAGFLTKESSAQSLTQVLTDLDTPTFVTSWPGNSNVLVVAERGSGKVTRYTASGGGGIPASGVVVDLSSKAFIPMNAYQEFIGVTGVAFHPKFLDDRSKRFIYVRYNEPAPNPTTIIERYRIPPGTLSADPSSGVELYSWPTLETTHGSGQIHFDTLDKGPQITLLYFAMPDDVLASGPCCLKARAQDDASDLGKLLAVNVEDGNPGGGVPPQPMTLAKGFRNPFGFSVDRGAGAVGQGDVWIGNTGQACSGDILRWPAGTSGVPNYGWPWKEGDCQLLDGQPPQHKDGFCINDVMCGEPPVPPTYTLPDRVVSNSLSGFVHDAMIGGYVYRNSTVPSLQDRYVYVLFVTPQVLSISASTPSVGTTMNHTQALGVNTWGQLELHGMGQDADGELYLIRVESAQPVTNNGTVYRIE